MPKKSFIEQYKEFAQQATKPVVPSKRKLTLSDQVRDQKYMMQQQNLKEPFAIVDKREKAIHYFNPDGSLIKSEPVLTGKSGRDKETAPSWNEYMKENEGAKAKDYLKYLAETKQQTTPAGIFEVGIKENVQQEPGWKGKAARAAESLLSGTPFALPLTKRRSEIEEARKRTYGPEGKILTLKSQYGVASSKAIHGTQYKDRERALIEQKPEQMGLTNGCVNVNGSTICFNTLKHKSKVVILPEETDRNVNPAPIVEISDGKRGAMVQRIPTTTRERAKEIRQTREYLRGVNKGGNLGMTDDELNFATAVAEKETKGGRSFMSKLESNILPGTFAKSYGMFEMKEDFPYLEKGKSPNNDTVALKAVRDYTRAKSLVPDGHKVSELSDHKALELYNLYNGAAYHHKTFGQDFLKNWYPVKYEYGLGGTLGTALFPAQESAYQTWRSKLPKRLQYEGNYDLRGFWKENPKFTAVEGQHMTDKFKLPNHPTFSNESQYYDETPGQGGYWKGGTFVPNPKIGPAMQKKRNGGPLVRGYLKKYAFGSPGPVEDETVIGGYPMQNDTASGDYNAATDWTGVDRNASKPDKNKKSWGVSRQQVGNGVMAAGQIVRSMDKTTFGDFRDDTDDFTDGAMNVVGQAGPWGALIAGIYNIVQPIAKGVRKRTEATDGFGNLTGSKRKINRTATLGAILSPSQAIANRIALNYYKPGWGGYADALQKKLKEEFNEKQAPYVEANRLYAEGRAGLQGDYAQGIKTNQYYGNGGNLAKAPIKPLFPRREVDRLYKTPTTTEKLKRNLNPYEGHWLKQAVMQTLLDQHEWGNRINMVQQALSTRYGNGYDAAALGLEAVKIPGGPGADFVVNAVQEDLQYMGDFEDTRVPFKTPQVPASDNTRVVKHAHGGSLVSSYLKANGGTLNQLSKSTVEVKGPTHENGGVQLPQVGAEVEGNETISNGYVFSDRLGFAQEHKKLARMQGKIEDKPATRERLNTLKLLKEKEGQLALAQEYLRKTLNLQ